MFACKRPHSDTLLVIFLNMILTSNFLQRQMKKNNHNSSYNTTTECTTTYCDRTTFSTEVGEYHLFYV